MQKNYELIIGVVFPFPVVTDAAVVSVMVVIVAARYS